MGSILQIRVLATTFDEAEVYRAWPRLAAMAWPPPSHRPVGSQAGVLELVQALHDQLRFGGWLGDRKARMEPGVTRLYYLKTQLEKALADRDPRKADELSYSLEDILDELEALALKS